ncbi:ABC-type multidrug transport system fused ATPase/permease subunit [Kibdelosporangium banguiense]|uniref:ABC-type multidrug transport system fused ATPase/permease subunit n=1 Tax=Kibdelosporangium banguiense TaxID=1365924 RepID=A0ABS4TZF9_9PSEU|nr:ABC transporter ATP-binding protein [Kibdelosporangium banguiense]MBP2329787.1 ABC-type multidrug transport system fused ATPase/permease subunit [Kibdelosporangium banguiense]
MDRKESETDETDEVSVFTLSAWRELLGYARPYRWTVVLGGVLGLLGGLTGLLEPMVTKELVDALERNETVGGLLLLLTVAVLASAMFSLLGSFLLGRTAESVVRDARLKLIRRILRLRVSQFARFPPGDLMSRVSTDTTLMNQAVSHALIDSVKGILMMVAILTAMVVMEPVLVLVTLGVLVVCGILVGILAPVYTRYNVTVQESLGDIGNTLERSLGAFRTIKATGVETQVEANAVAASDRAWKYGVKLARMDGAMGAIAMMGIHLSFLAVLGIGGARVASGDTALGTLIAFLLYLFYLIEPATELLDSVAQFSAGVAAVRRIRDVQQLDVEADIEHRALPGDDTRTSASLRFEDVVFRYPDTESAVHHGVSFDVPPGGVTAFVGASGAGKSTLFALIERFYEPDSGQITLDGRDIGHWPLGRLRSAIGYVEQDAPVLAGTLRENLLLGVDDASDEDIDRVLVSTRLDGLVARLPDGLDTKVGHRGNTLSGGERQRIAVARALLRRPRLLLLDEVTSQLDALNELALREAIEHAAKETTVLVVAHRLSTVVRADRIVVMEAGRVRAIGAHHELVENDDLYRELAATQLIAAQ